MNIDSIKAIRSGHFRILFHFGLVLILSLAITDAYAQSGGGGQPPPPGGGGGQPGPKPPSDGEPLAGLPTTFWLCLIMAKRLLLPMKLLQKGLDWFLTIVLVSGVTIFRLPEA